MKKIIKRFIAFVFATALLLAPLSTPITTYAASQSYPVLTYFSKTLKEYTYQPSPYELQPGETITLSNLTGGGGWDIPAGKSFQFAYNLQYTNNIKVTVIRTSQPSGIVFENTTNDWGTDFINVAPQTQDCRYYVTIQCVGTEPALVKNYFGYYY